MTETFVYAALWLGLAVLATIISYHLKLSMALVEIVMGMTAGALAEYFAGPEAFGADLPWLRFLAATGAVVLTFLAGAELEPKVLRAKWKEVSTVGMVGFLAPFVGCTAIARFLLHWDVRASLLTGVALSTTSMAVVYAVMLETGLNRTDFGKSLLGACFINDLGTVIALGLLFAPFTYRTLVFVAATTAAAVVLPRLTRHLTHIYGFRTAAVRTKWVLLLLFGLGALALWSGSEAVLPAYIAGMVLAGAAAEDHHWVRRMRTLTIGLLTPFYFIRAGSLVALAALAAAPLVFLVLLGGKIVSKVFGLYPIVARFRREHNERWYHTLLMSTGLTFGTISALYGLTHGIVTRAQYSYLVAAVIASALVPTMVASFAFVPKHLVAEAAMLPAEPELAAAMADHEELADEE